MTDNLKKLIAAARNHKFTESDQEEQRRSFAFGNTNIENPRVTRETVAKEADSLKAKANEPGRRKE